MRLYLSIYPYMYIARTTLTDVVWGHSVSLKRPTGDVTRHNSDILSEPTSGSKKPANQDRRDPHRGDPHKGLRHTCPAEMRPAMRPARARSPE